MTVCSCVSFRSPRTAPIPLSSRSCVRENFFLASDFFCRRPFFLLILVYLAAPWPQSLMCIGRKVYLFAGHEMKREREGVVDTRHRSEKKKNGARHKRAANASTSTFAYQRENPEGTRRPAKNGKDETQHKLRRRVKQAQNPFHCRFGAPFFSWSAAFIVALPAILTA